MDTDERFTDGRVPDAHVRILFKDEHRWQRWLDVEVALAKAEAENGVIPQASAQAIASSADMQFLDADRIRSGIRRTSHPLMALVTELSNTVGDPHGGYVHWGATTQNITQTGDALLLREVHYIFLHLLGEMFASMEELASKGKNMVCAGRTHGQHAVPITFGFKVASWIDEFARHVDRLREVEPRLFTVMIGGAVGNYASLGEKGPAVQEEMAHILNLNSMPVPSRAMTDFQAEYVCTLGLLAGTCGRIAKEIYMLMEPEFGEAFEPIPEGTIGSSTMPHKRNPQLADDCIAISSQIRSLVPFALDGMLHDHEVSGAYSAITDDAVKRACVLTGDLLTRMNVILAGMQLDEKRMRANLDRSGGLIMSEAVMLQLGKVIGRQQSHEIIYEAAQQAATGKTSFKELLSSDVRVTTHIDKAKLAKLLDPATHIGLSSRIAEEAAKKAHILSVQLQKTSKAEFNDQKSSLPKITMVKRVN